MAVEPGDAGRGSNPSEVLDARAIRSTSTCCGSARVTSRTQSEVEPLPAGSPLRRLTNVLLTPHCAGGSIEAAVAMTERCVDNILAIRDGRALGEDS